MTPKQIETVLRVRRNRRDQVRRALALMLNEARAIENAIGRTQAGRAEALAELRAGTAGGDVDIDRAAGLRYHAGRLSIELSTLAQSAAANGELVRKARAVLVKADQGVKAVERLKEQNAALQRREAERRADREATDRFSAVRADERETGLGVVNGAGTDDR